jgi:hypothetical protein
MLRTSIPIHGDTLYWKPEGPLLVYGDGFLQIEDLNPQLKTRWRMGRRELFWLGWRMVKAALRKPIPSGEQS